MDVYRRTTRVAPVGRFGLPGRRKPQEVVLRLHSRKTSDRFATQVAEAATCATRDGGSVLTHPFTFEGARLLLNYSTSAAGSVRIEVLTPAGEAIPALSGDAAPELYGDAIAAEYQWPAPANLAAWSGQPIRLRIHLTDADLYSIQFQP